MLKNQPQVALVYDKVNTPYGGAEHVLLALNEAFPKSPLYTAVYDAKRAAWAKPYKVVPSFLQKLPGAKSRHQFLAALMPLAFESFDLGGYDIVISVTSGEAKGVLTKPNQLHICYLLTPPRYLYSHQKEYLDSYWFSRLPLLRQISGLLLRYLQWWDQSAALRPDLIIPISNLVRERAEGIYKTTIEKPIYPPVPDIPMSNESLALNSFYLVASRLVPYKKVDIAVSSCKKLNKCLVIVGEGTANKSLIGLAGEAGSVRKQNESLTRFIERAQTENKIILFTNNCTEAELGRLFANARALLMPGTEDFGITAMQAGMMGKPVILTADSGAAELLKEGRHAIFLKEVSQAALENAILRLEKYNWNSESMRNNAEKHSVKNFTTQFSKKVYDLFITYQNPDRKAVYELPR